MTYLAPRQRLFAIIILISFCLHILLLTFFTVTQTNKNRIYKGERMLTHIVNESRLAITNKDRVGLSVIANRYANEYDVNAIIIRNLKDEILVQVGNAPMQQGETIKKIATENDVIIGNIELTMKSADTSEIIKTLWPFILGSFFIHVILWLLYRQFARPDRAQIHAISQGIHDYYQQEYPQMVQGESITTDAHAIYEPDNQSFSLDGHHSDEFDTGLQGNAQLQSDVAQPTKHPLTQKKVFAELTSYIQKQHTQAQQTTLSNHTNTKVDKDSTTPSSQLQKIATNTALNNPTTELTETNKSSGSAHTTELTTITKQNTEQDKSVNLSISKTDNTATDNTTNATDKFDITKPSQLDTNLTDTSLANTIPKQATADPTQLPSVRSPNHTANRLSIDSAIDDSVQDDFHLVSTNKLRLYFRYVDSHNLLAKLSPAVADPYFQLCTQLLKQAIKSLLKDDSFKEIKLVNTPKFSHQGAMVEFAVDGNNQQAQQKLTLASVMLAILYRMLNQIIYDKHRELGRFALTMSIGISYIERESAMKQLMKHHSKGHDIVLLLTKPTLTFLQDYISLRRINYPTNVAQRECAYVDKVDENLLQALSYIRNSVLRIDE